MMLRAVTRRAFSSGPGRKFLNVPKLKPLDKVAPPVADAEGARLRRAIRARRKQAVSAKETRLDTPEDHPHLDMVPRGLHVDSLRLARAGSMLEVDLKLTGVVEDPDDKGTREERRREFKDLDPGFSPAFLGNTADLENDGWLRRVLSKTSLDTSSYLPPLSRTSGWQAGPQRRGGGQQRGAAGNRRSKADGSG